MNDETPFGVVRGLLIAVPISLCLWGVIGLMVAWWL